MSKQTQVTLVTRLDDELVVHNKIHSIILPSRLRPHLQTMQDEQTLRDEQILRGGDCSNAYKLALQHVIDIIDDNTKTLYQEHLCNSYDPDLEADQS